MLGFAFSHFSIQSGERLLLPTAAGLSVNGASGWAMVAVRGAKGWVASLLGPDAGRLGRAGTRWTWNIYFRRGHSPSPGAGCRQQRLGCAGIELVPRCPSPASPAPPARQHRAQPVLLAGNRKAGAALEDNKIKGLTSRGQSSTAFPSAMLPWPGESLPVPAASTSVPQSRWVEPVMGGTVL